MAMFFPGYSVRGAAPRFEGRYNSRKELEKKVSKIGTSVALGSGALCIGTTATGGGPAAFEISVRELMPMARVLVPATMLSGGGYAVYSMLEGDKKGSIEEPFDPKVLRANLQAMLADCREDLLRQRQAKEKIFAIVAEEERRLKGYEAQDVAMMAEIQQVTKQDQSDPAVQDRVMVLRRDYGFLQDRIKDQREFVGTCRVNADKAKGRAKELEEAVLGKQQKYEDLLSHLERLEKLAEMQETLDEQAKEHLGSDSASSKEMYELRAKVEAEYLAYLSTAESAKVETQALEALAREDQREALKELQGVAADATAAAQPKSQSAKQ